MGIFFHTCTHTHQNPYLHAWVWVPLRVSIDVPTGVTHGILFIIYKYTSKKMKIQRECAWTPEKPIPTWWVQICRHDPRVNGKGYGLVAASSNMVVVTYYHHVIYIMYIVNNRGKPLQTILKIFT